MIKKDELLKIQKESGLPLATIEKDYVLSLLIWSIAQNEHLRHDWVFKGGTCLKKCYFGQYRFSEDLDYTLIPAASIEPDQIKDQLTRCFDTIFENFGLRIQKENLVLSPFPDKQGMFIQIKVPYYGPLMMSGSLPKIKLDLSKDEILFHDPVQMPLLHPYSDHLACATTVTCYSLYEIFSEKLRALVQRTRPRDLYDVIHLADRFSREKFDENILHEVSEKKFAHKGLRYPDALQSISEQALIEARAGWEVMLRHQVSNLEEIHAYLERFQKLLERLSSSYKLAG